jgi:hypothetical protein
MPSEDYEAAIMSLPGVSTLQKIRSLEEVVFSGDCPVLEGMLKEAMESPISKKRKSIVVEVEDWGRPKRDARSKTVQKT